jgi:hypothetical protein
MKKHSYDKDFFKHWSNDMAYVLGFWFADGYISMNHKTNTSKTFAIVQSTKDKYILQLIKQKMHFSGEVKEEAKSVYPKSILRIYSKEIYDDIILLGGMEKKSSIVKFPYIAEEYLKKFLLGFFDGDGSVTVDKRNVMKLVFTGGEQFLLTIKEKILKTNLLNDDTGYGNMNLLNTPSKKTYNLELFEELQGPPEPTLIDALRDFLPVALKVLDLDHVPKIKLKKESGFSNEDFYTYL